MLQALNRNRELCNLQHLQRSEINRLKRQETFFCPVCYKKVFIRFSKRMLPHFVHYSETNCTGSGESVYHQQAKMQLYNWLKKQYNQVYLEKYVEAINQYPDVYVETEKRKIACEFQAAKISSQTILDRNDGYKRSCIQPIWIIGHNQLIERNNQSFQLNAFLKQFIYQFDLMYPPTIYFYCPTSYYFTVWSDIYPLQAYAYGKKTLYSIHSISFPHLFTKNRLSATALFTSWENEKKKFRLHYRRRVYGIEWEWRNWLYEKGYFIENLPAIIHLPIQQQFQVTVPLWHWQSRFIIDFFYPLPKFQSFCLQDVLMYYAPKIMGKVSIEHHIVNHPLAQYIAYLVCLGYVKQVSPTHFMKIKQISFYDHIETAIKRDTVLLTKLKKEQNIPILTRNSLY